jgi:hypothetical protein
VKHLIAWFRKRELGVKDPRSGLPWTLREDRKLLAVVRRKGTPPNRGAYNRSFPYWQDVGWQLGRSPWAVQTRWRALQAGLRLNRLHGRLVVE